MLRCSPVYVPEIEPGGHVKNNACAVEIKIKWIKPKQMTHENTYRDDKFSQQMKHAQRTEKYIRLIFNSYISDSDFF